MAGVKKQQQQQSLAIYIRTYLLIAKAGAHLRQIFFLSLLLLQQGLGRTQLGSAARAGTAGRGVRGGHSQVPRLNQAIWKTFLIRHSVF